MRPTRALLPQNMNTERPIMRFRGDLYDTIVSETIGTKMLFSVSRMSFTLPPRLTQERTVCPT